MKYTLLLFLMSLNCQSGFSQKKIYPDVFPGEEILIEGKPVNLSGSLLLPLRSAGEKVPVFVFLSGSGDFSYRSHFHPTAEYTLFKDLSQLLLARGYAVFFLEKRGINESSGNWRRSGFADYAADVARVIRYIKQRPETDPAQIGLIGHSQGGYIAQVVAAEHPEDIRMLINLAGPVVPVYDQVLTDMRSQYICRGITGSKLNLKMKGVKTSLDAARFSSPFIRPVFISRVIGHDPAPYITRIQCPMLSIYAENDYMADFSDNTKRLAEIGNNHFQNTVIIMNGLNHHFVKSDICYDWKNWIKLLTPCSFN